MDLLPITLVHDAIPSEEHGFIFEAQCCLIQPDCDRFPYKTPLAVEPPVADADVAMEIHPAHKLHGIEDAVKHSLWVHRSLDPAEHLRRTMVPVLAVTMLPT